jgi:enoyl-CoA hydratase/carnithine racemase
VTENELGTPHLRFERDGSIAWCTIDRPAKRNALTPAMYFGIRRAVHLVEAEPGLAALILTGVGDVFAPGGDLGGRTEPGEEPVPDGVGTDVLPFLTVRDSRVPVVSAVNGLCQGGGLLIAMLSDVAVASDRATFRAPELLRGIPDAFYAAALPAHVGIAVARDLLLTGRVLDAEEARTLGLIARVVPHDQLRDAALETAHQVLRTAPDARVHVKRMLNERYGPIDTQTMNWALATSAELREGMVAFLEKRPPAWIPPDVP